MTLWTSTDDGATFQKRLNVDAGAAGYSSLQVRPATAGDRDCDTVFLLYEQADPAPTSFSTLSASAFIGNLAVLDPDRFVFLERAVC